MKIQPVNLYSVNRQYNNYKKNSNPTFGTHPDFYKLSQKWDVSASSYFRRGQRYGLPSDNYSDVEKVLENVFKDYNGQSPKKVLIVGIGDSQEPFSYLSTIKSLHKAEHMAKMVDLYSVDLQDKPSWDKLIVDSYYDSDEPIKYASDSFIFDAGDYGQLWTRNYRVSSDILSLVYDAYNNPLKSKWETPIQTAIKSYNDRFFDIISANNTLFYIEDRRDLESTLSDIERSLKRGGYFITDPNHFYFGNPWCMRYFKEVSDGIFQKM